MLYKGKSCGCSNANKHEQPESKAQLFGDPERMLNPELLYSAQKLEKLSNSYFTYFTARNHKVCLYAEELGQDGLHLRETVSAI